MRRIIIGALLASTVAGAAVLQAAPPAQTGGENEPITITAPREKPQPALKAARDGGAAVAAGGLGAMGYIVWAAPTGPFGWAAAAVFLGGMSAYLSHRRLKGHDDFSPGQLEGGRGAARGLSSSERGAAAAPYPGR